MEEDFVHPVKQNRNCKLNCFRIVKLKPQFTSRLGNKVMFVTQGSKCWKLTATCTDTLPELECNHEEAADTHILVTNIKR